MQTWPLSRKVLSRTFLGPVASKDLVPTKCARSRRRDLGFRVQVSGTWGVGGSIKVELERQLHVGLVWFGGGYASGFLGQAELHISHNVNSLKGVI